MVYNNFRSGDLQARTGNKLTDLYTDIVYVCLDECPQDHLYVVVAVGNQGTLDNIDPIILELWGLNTDATEVLLDIMLIEEEIAAGQQLSGIELLVSIADTELVSIYAYIDAPQVINECNEGNNMDFWSGPLCP